MLVLKRTPDDSISNQCPVRFVGFLASVRTEVAPNTRDIVKLRAKEPQKKVHGSIEHSKMMLSVSFSHRFLVKCHRS